MSESLALRLRRANPHSTRRSDPVSLRGEALLASFDVRSRRAPHTRTGISCSESGRAVVALTAITVIALSGGRPPLALTPTPAPLRPEAMPGSARTIMAQLSRLGAKRMTSSTPSPEIIAENTWALDTMIDEGGRFLSRPVVPQWRTVRVGEDGAIRVTLIAAEPFVGFPSEHLAAPGTVLAETEDEDGAEEWALTYPLPIPADPAGIGAYLAQCHGGASPSVGDYFVEVRNLLSVRLLSAVQEAAILRFLAELPGLRIDGSITDRLGRTGIVFRATDRMPGRYEDLLIVSPASGKILAAEKIYVGAERTDIPSPAVVDYVAWA